MTNHTPADEGHDLPQEPAPDAVELQQRTAAGGERRAPTATPAMTPTMTPAMTPAMTPTPVSGMTSGGPMPSAPLGGPYPPVPYAPYAPYAPYSSAPYPPAYQPYPPYRPYPESAPAARPTRERQPVSRWVIAAGSVLVALALVMALCIVGAGVLQGMSWIAGPAHATDARSFSVSGTPTVTLHMDAGTVHVVSGGSGQVSVSLYKEVHAITHAAAQQALDGITLDATQSGDAITITAHGVSFDANFASLYRTLDLTLTVPASANLSATVRAGNMEIGDVAGALDVQMDAGNLTLRNVTLQGDSSLRLSAGNLDFRGTLDPGAAVDVSVDAGNTTLRLPRATPTHLAARTSAGNISITGWPGGDTHARSNDTLALDLNPQPTNTLTVRVSFGNVSVLAST